MSDTRDVSHDEPSPPSPGGGDPEADMQHDLHWAVPLSTWVPLAALLCGGLVVAFGADRVLVLLLPFAVLLSAITVIDLRELRVPNRLLKPAAVAAVPLLVIAASSTWPDLSLVRGLLGAVAMGAIYFVLALIHPAGMGFGDVKLSPLIGATLGLFGWVPFARGLFLAFLIVGPVAIVLLVLQRAGAKTGLPFAPFMAAGALVALFLEAL